MVLYAGFDEAGYGPLLGPLCVASTAFLLPDGDPDTPPDLWKALASAVCRSRKDRRSRIAICDSKALKGVKDARVHPLHAIERGVLAAAAALHGSAPHDEASLDAALGRMSGCGSAPATTAACEAEGVTLPCACSADDVAVAAAMLRRACASSGITLVSLSCAAITPAELNADACRGLTKPSIPFARAAAMAIALLDAHAGTMVRLAFDRQGGRMRYADDLRHSFGGNRLSVLHEDEERSVYRFERDGRTVVASFETGGESRHLPVALASMVAKYVRELRMARVNRFFARLAPEVPPTAGYVTDGRRFLAQVEPHLQALGIERSGFVRSI
jgi:ribonuclease HII